MIVRVVTISKYIKNYVVLSIKYPFPLETISQQYNNEPAK